MPDHNYPPFARDVGGSQQPRQLNRWLDVSPQGGSLQRTQGYIELPAFDQAVDWKGYSEIVAAWNYAAPNNFVLIDFSSLPINPNYVLCIAYQLNGVIYRYKLTGDGGVFYFELAEYVKQTIKKNFRLEVWSVADANVSETIVRQIFTSVRGTFDYRFANDFKLVDNGAILTDFQCDTFEAGEGTPAIKFTSDNFVEGLGPGNVTDWPDTQSLITLTKDFNPPFIGDNTSLDLIGDSSGILENAQMSGAFVTSNAFNQYYFAFKLNTLTASGSLFALTNLHTTSISIVNDTLTLNHLSGTITSPALEQGRWYICMIDYGTLSRTGVLRIFDTTDTETLDPIFESAYFVRTASDYSNWQSMQLGDNTDNAYKAQIGGLILGYTATSNATNEHVLMSIAANVGVTYDPRFLIPLTVPSNTSVPTN